MTGKMILIASVILLALPGSAVACAAKVHLHGSVVRTASQAEDHANAYNWAVPISTAEPGDCNELRSTRSGLKRTKLSGSRAGPSFESVCQR